MSKIRTVQPPPARASSGRAVRCWTLVSGDGAIDVEVEATDDHSLGEVLASLRSEVGVPVDALWVGSRRLAGETRLGAAELRHGAVLGVGRPGPREPFSARPSALELRITGGPAAGTVLPLRQGTHVVGRGAGAAVHLDDPDVSRRHLEVLVGCGGVSVTDLGSTNGTRLGGEPLREGPQPWPTGVGLRLGTTTLVLGGPAGGPAGVETTGGGRVVLRRQERLLAPPPQAEIAFPRPPEDAPRRRLPWAAAALPAVAGAAMAAWLHQPTFLFFALLSPVVAASTWLTDRISARRSSRRAAARYAADLAAAEIRLTEAVRDDMKATAEAHPDLAALAGAALRRSHRLWERARCDDDSLVARIGSGPGPSRVVQVSPDGTRSAVTAPDRPVLVDLRLGGLGVVGPRERSGQVLAGLVAQLASLHAPSDLGLLLLVETDRLGDWTWTRWLPHLGPDAVLALPTPGAPEVESVLQRVAGLVERRRAAMEHAPGSSRALPWLLCVVDGTLDERVAAALRAAGETGLVVLTHATTPDRLAVAVPAVLRLTGETGDGAVLSRAGTEDQPAVTVDRMPPGVALSMARSLAALAPAQTSAGLPREVGLLDLPSGGIQLAADGAMSGCWSWCRKTLVAALGRTADGPFTVDLCRTGPHALIAGTTGSGKSELLQTLIVGLALQHPPDRCSFLLIDYKGGAAFAAAVGLPHTVGLLTDLDAQSTARALRSLGAELTRREEILAAHRAVDIADLADDVPLARLVIVVDEFASLADDLPSFVPDLVGIAQRGRSLGVHLVLATQRPSGVVSPEIRANCSLRICLRTADDGDSRDVLGTPEAAHVPLDLPGRGFVRLGSGPTTAVQIARVSAAAGAGPSEPLVRRWIWPAPGLSSPAANDGENDLDTLCRTLAGLARDQAIRPAHRPWLPPLPAELTADDLDRFPSSPNDQSRTSSGGRLRLGVVDRPDAQRQEALEVDLTSGGGWLAIGGPRSGRTTMLRSVLRRATHALGSTELHVHVIDAGGGALAEEAAGLPHAGTCIGRDDPLRTVRLVDRLTDEIAERRAGGVTGRPRVLLLVDGADEVIDLLDEVDPGGGGTGLLRLVRSGAAVGLTTFLTADRAVPGGRLAAAAAQRLVLPLPDRADYVIAGVPVAAVPPLRPPGRAVFGEEALECHLALPPEPAPSRSAARPPSGGALCIPVLPADPVVAMPAERGEPDEALLLPLGPGGDEGAVVAVDLVRAGGLLVAGPPRSGRSSLLDALHIHLQATGTSVLRMSPRRGPAADPAWVRPDDAVGIREWLRSLDGRIGVILADDLGAPSDAPALGELPTSAEHQSVQLVAASTAGQLSAHYQGPVAALRRSRSGLLLCPQPGDADLLGIRLPRTPVPTRPGSGWWVDGGIARRVQVARRRVPAGGAPG